MPNRTRRQRRKNVYGLPKHKRESLASLARRVSETVAQRQGWTGKKGSGRQTLARLVDEPDEKSVESAYERLRRRGVEAVEERRAATETELRQSREATFCHRGFLRIVSPETCEFYAEEAEKSPRGVCLGECKGGVERSW